MPKFWHKFLFCQCDKKVYIDNDKPPEVKEDTKFAKQLSFLRNDFVLAFV